MGAYLEDKNCEKTGSEATLAEQKQSKPQARAEGVSKNKAKAGSRPPDCGQVPVAMSNEPQPEAEAVVLKPVTGGEPALKTAVERPPLMPATQVYAPQIAAGSIFLSILIGFVVFKLRADRKRLSKRCPHCNGRLERWADECRNCGKNIFVYPSV
jgi:hypothetical protein